MALFLNICNSADFDHFYLCSTFYYLMSSYNKKNNPYIFKNRYRSAFILFLGGEEGKADNFPPVFSAEPYQRSFAFLLFCISCFLSARLRAVRAGTQAQTYCCC